jgi:hypothetical protein
MLRQQGELRRMPSTGSYSIADLAGWSAGPATV